MNRGPSEDKSLFFFIREASMHIKPEIVDIANEILCLNEEERATWWKNPDYLNHVLEEARNRGLFNTITPEEVIITRSVEHAGIGIISEDPAHKKERIKEWLIVAINELISVKYVTGGEKKDSGSFMAWDYFGAYHAVKEDDIATLCEMLLPGNVSDGIITKVLGSLRRNKSTDIEEWNRDPAQIAVMNGVLTLWPHFEFRRATPEDLISVQIPVKYDKSAKCPTVTKMVKDILDHDDINLYWEIVGYCLYRAFPIPGIFLFIGPGGNGKSSLLNFITRLLGVNNVSGVALQNMDEESKGGSRFNAWPLWNKLANIKPDLPNRPMKDGNLAKSISGGDMNLMIERKFKDPFFDKIFAKPVFGSNYFVAPENPTEADYRRYIYIRPPHKFSLDPKEVESGEAKAANLAFLAGDFGPEEMAGALNEAIAGLHRVLKAEKFSYKMTPEDVANLMATFGNPDHIMDRFMKAVLTRDETAKPEDCITAKLLQDEFMQYCIKICGFKTHLGKNQINQLFREHAAVFLRADGVHTRHYPTYRLKTPEDLT